MIELLVGFVIEPQKLLNSLSFSFFPLQLRFCHWAKPPPSSIYFSHHSISSISLFVVFFCIKSSQFFWIFFWPSQSKNEQINLPPPHYFWRVIILWFLVEEKEMLNFSTNFTFLEGTWNLTQPISRQAFNYFILCRCTLWNWDVKKAQFWSKFSSYKSMNENVSSINSMFY
jgi:hypothetical protein